MNRRGFFGLLGAVLGLPFLLRKELKSLTPPATCSGWTSNEGRLMVYSDGEWKEVPEFSG